MDSFRFRAVALVVCSLLVAASCGSATNDEAQESPPEAVASVEAVDVSDPIDEPSMFQVNVAASGTIDSSPVWIADSQGFFEEAGISVKFVPVSESAGIVEALLDGRADAVAIPASPILKLVGEGEALRVVNYLNATSPEATRHAMTLVTASGASIEAGCDLVGAEVGVDQVESLVAHAVFQMVINDGCDPESIVFVEASLGFQLDLLEQGDVDAVAVFEPYTARATRRGFVEVANLDRELCPGLLRCPVGIIAVHDEWADENPDLSFEFNRAINRAMLWMESQQISYRAELVNCCGIDAEDAADLRVGDWVGDVSALEPDLNRLMDILEAQGHLPNRPAIADVIG